MLDGVRRRTSRATGGSVGRDPLSARVSVLFTKTLRQVRLAPEVGFVGCPSAKYHGWDPRVVVVEVGCYQSLEAGKRVELMQVEPPMPELGPQSLDQVAQHVVAQVDIVQSR